MPLSVAPVGKTAEITKIIADEKTRHHLGNLGFLVGAEIVPISDRGGDMIVNIKDCRLAINKDLAMRIHVKGGEYGKNS